MILDNLVTWSYEKLIGYSKKKTRIGLYDFLRRVINQYEISQKEHIINVGAGGAVSDLISSLGVLTRSVDIDPNRYPDIIANIEGPMPFPNSSIDVVFLIEVLEHTQYPGKALAEIERILKPGGIIVGSTPFILGLHDAPSDYFRFTEYGLRALLTEYKLEFISAKNNSISCTSALLSRMFVEGSRKRCGKIVLFSPLIISLCAILETLSKFVPDNSATTGFVFVVRKKVR